MESSSLESDRLQKSQESVLLLREFLMQTPTPGHRMFAVAGLITSIYTGLANALESGALSRDVVIETAERLKNLKSLFADPPANFVEMLAMFHTELESAKLNEEFDDRYSSLIDTMQRLLHSVAFSPPSEVQSNATEVAADLADLAAFVKEFKAETDRGAALVGASLIDNRLQRLLREHFVDESIAKRLLSNKSALGSFSSRIEASYALGLLTEVEFRECDLIRRIRNEFAHKLHGLTLDSPRIADQCRELKAMPYERWGSPRQRFTNSVITLCLVLWHRPAHAAHLKAREREWPWHLAFGNMRTPK